LPHLGIVDHLGEQIFEKTVAQNGHEQMEPPWYVFLFAWLLFAVLWRKFHAGHCL
jgi:hypothetical protein